MTERLTNSSKVKGNKSEEIAVKFLEGKGYVVLERNFRCSKKEIDIIAKIADKIVFVEVKGRSEKADFNPEYSITAAKQKSIFQVANYYVEKNNLSGVDFGFDVILVNFTDSGVKIEHLENALQFF